MNTDDDDMPLASAASAGTGTAVATLSNKRKATRLTSSTSKKRVKREPEKAITVPKPEPLLEDDLPLVNPNAKVKANGSSKEAIKSHKVAALQACIKTEAEVTGRKLNGNRLKRSRVKSKIVKGPSSASPAVASTAVGNGDASQEGDEQYKWWDDSGAAEKGANKWTTLVHQAVLFPPEYEAHGVRILYDGKPIDLSPACEEVATFFAAKIGTDYEKKDTFRTNFFHDFRAILKDKSDPAVKIIKELDKCDFSGIKAHLDAEREKKKDVPSAERKALKEAEAERVKKYTIAFVDGREEKVGNFRVEPPGLFLGRGEHPLMGKVKSRIYPEDISINIGKDAPVPVPLPGHSWGKISHDRTVTWLCGWKDTITNGRKYVFLSAGSAFKGMSDLQKFEKARTLGKNIERIRADYQAGWSSKSKEVRQRSVAMYLIDKLALRVGNEKNEEEADTVGCCSLRVEHIKLIEPRSVEFDFLGKDSMRYHEIVEVDKKVFDNFRLFVRSKAPEKDVFHRLTVIGLNDYLKSLMPGLSAKVFRTYNASVTLDKLLDGTDPAATVNENEVFYNQQNKEVAILCNHQRSAPKGHEAQMNKMQSHIDYSRKYLTELLKKQRVLRSKKNEDTKAIDVTEFRPVKAELTDEMDDKAKAAERKRVADLPRYEFSRNMTIVQIDAAVKRTREKLAKLEANAQVKDDLKTVALGTSKINYLDPRITVAWCKKHDVPIERIFASTLLVKFAWAMPTPSTFVF